LKNLIITILVLILTTKLAAQWSSDPTLNNPICVESGSQESTSIISDGTGGAIITWVDFRSGDSDIYVQRINASGIVQWNSNGVSICTISGNQEAPAIAGDGSGGAIITWVDWRNGTSDIFVQKINSNGVVQWTLDGVPICTLIENQKSPAITSNGSGGAIITWEDERNGTLNKDIYAQMISLNGLAQWTPDGVLICTASERQSAPSILAHSSGGAIITWYDLRNGTQDIYAQLISASGTVQWNVDGVPICIANSRQWLQKLVDDGSDGAIIVWEDARSDNGDVYAQRINVSGIVQWTANGIPISAAIDRQITPRILGYGSNGVVITWLDLRNGNFDIYAQRITVNGLAQWTSDGIPVCTFISSQNNQKIISDGSDGAIISWDDDRNSTTFQTSWDIFTQRLSASGNLEWSTNGLAISLAGGNQYYQNIISDGSGGAILTWVDERISADNRNIYAQQVNQDGQLGITTDVEKVHRIPNNFILEQNYPNPFNPSTKISWKSPVSSHQTLKVYDVLGNEVATLVDEYKTAGSYSVDFDASNLSSGFYFYKLQVGSFTASNKMIYLK
jgi:predicted lipoprotein with Yx(FWY)xxD motif